MEKEFCCVALLKIIEIAWENTHIRKYSVYGNVPPKWVSFSPKHLRYESHFCYKTLQTGSHLTEIAKKKSKKSVIFELKNP